MGLIERGLGVLGRFLGSGLMAGFSDVDATSPSEAVLRETVMASGLRSPGGRVCFDVPTLVSSAEGDLYVELGRRKFRDREGWVM